MAIFSKPKKNKIALCLGGGGARGFAHIGALKAFEEEGIAFDLVAGTSVGSMIAALYAAGISAAKMEQIADEIDLKQVRSGFTPNEPLKIGALVRNVLGEARIEDFSTPLYIVAVDIVTARQIILDKGPAFEAVSASCAVPVLFKPFIRGNMHLVDGGILNNIPADVCRMMGADYVITIDINPTRGGGTEGLGIMDVAKATLGIVTAAASQTGLINSDVIIAPDLSRFKATKKDGHDEMIALGYEAAKEQMARIKEIFGMKEGVRWQTRQEKKQQKIAEKQAAKEQKIAEKAKRKSAKSKEE